MTNHIKCQCGNQLTDQNVSYDNGCNDEGEDYAIYKFRCKICETEIEFHRWCECEDIEEAKKEVAKYIWQL